PRQRGVDPAAALIDLALEKDLDRFFVHPVANEMQDDVLTMMKHPRAVVTFSDSGAHVSQIVDSSLQTHLLSHWVRERQVFTLEDAVRMLTLVPATHWGFADRGLVREGFVADLVVFDPDTIAPEMPEVAHDLPAGARRLVPRAARTELERGAPTRPPAPRTLGAFRRSRNAPRIARLPHGIRAGGPDMAPRPPHARGVPAKP